MFSLSKLVRLFFTVTIFLASALHASAADSISLPSSFVGDSASFKSVYPGGSQPVSSTATTDSFRVTFSVSSGSIQLTQTSGLAAVTGYPSANWTSGTATEIAFTGSFTNVNNAAASLQYKGVEGVMTASVLNITSSGDASYFSDTGSYYKFVNSGVTWNSARVAARSSTLNGMAGYLATVTSASEFTFIKNKAGASQVWLGGSDVSSEGVWRWIDDPGVPADESGVQFWQGAGAGYATNGMYTSWNTGEPNDSGGNEDALQIESSGNWNDLPTNSTTLPYVIEYTPSASDGSQATLNIQSATAPTLTSSNPSDGATNINPSANLTLTFSEAVTAGSGNVYIKRSSDDATVATLAVTNTSLVSVSSNVVTLNPSSDLGTATDYYILVDATAFDASDDSASFAGISSASALNFTTAGTHWADWVIPGSFPLSNTANATYKYATGTTGTIQDPNNSNDTVNITLTGEVAYWSSNNATWVNTENPSTAYDIGTVTSPNGEDRIDQTGYTLQEYKHHTISFDQAVEGVVMGIWSLGGGQVSELLFSRDFSIIDTESAGLSKRVTPEGYMLVGAAAGSAGGAAGMIQFYGSLSSITYTVTEPEIYSGISVALTTNPLTGTGGATKSIDTTAPTLIFSDPADNDINVPTGSNITLQFSEAVVDGGGTITLKKTSDNSTVQTFTGYTISGDTIVLDPTNDLDIATSYYIQISAGAVKDETGNAYAGISDTVTLNFSTPTSGDPVEGTSTGTPSSPLTSPSAKSVSNCNAKEINNVTFSATNIIKSCTSPSGTGQSEVQINYYANTGRYDLSFVSSLTGDALVGGSGAMQTYLGDTVPGNGTKTATIEYACNDSDNDGLIDVTGIFAWNQIDDTFVLPTPPSPPVINAPKCTSAELYNIEGLSTDSMALPEIKVSKYDDVFGTLDPANVGDVISYTILVENTGNVALTGVSVADPMTDGAGYVSGDTNENTLLDVGEIWQYFASYTLTADDLTAGEISNLATATASVPGGTPFQVESKATGNTVVGTGNGEATVSEITAGEEEITVTKTDDSSGTVDPAAVNDVLTYTITVENTGEVDLINVSVADELTDGATYVSGDTGSDNVLGVDETWIYSASLTLTQDHLDAGEIENLALVTAESILGDKSTVESSATGNAIPGVDQGEPTKTKIVGSPQMTVTKTDDVSGTLNAADIGSVITYTITVENTGNVALSNVIVTDPNTGTPTYLGGDHDEDEILSVGEYWTYQATYTLTADDFDTGAVLNKASFTATPPASVGGTVTVESSVSGNTTATGTDTQTTLVAGAAEMKVTKTDDVFGTLPPTTVADDTFTYTITVENTGEVSLTSVSVVDDNTDTPTLVEGDLNNNSILEVGETWRYTATHTVTADEITAGKVENTATVSATPLGGSEVDVESSATGNVTVGTGNGSATVTDIVAAVSQMTVTKTADETALSSPPVVGDVISYTITVKNTGNIDLEDVSLADPRTEGATYVSGDEATRNYLLSADETENGDGEAWIFSASYSLTQDDLDAGQVDNLAIATAKGYGGGYSSVESSATGNATAGGGQGDATVTTLTQSAAATISNDLINMTRLLSASYQATSRMVITNTGNVTLNGIDLTNDLDAWLGSGNLLSIDSVSLVDAPLGITLDATYDGETQTSLLASGADLIVDGSVTVDVTFSFSTESGYPTGNDVASLDATNLSSPVTDNANLNVNDIDGDGAVDSTESSVADRDRDGKVDAEDYDPAGYFYCEEDGSILDGGLISVSGTTTDIIMDKDGSDGQFAWRVTSPGTYTMSVFQLPTVGSLSSTRYPPSPITVDVTSLGSGSVSLGGSEVGSTGFINDFSESGNPYYMTFAIEAGDPDVLNNNIPFEKCSIGEITLTADSDGREIDDGTPEDGLFTITLPRESAHDVTVTYTLSGTAIEGADYTARTGTVTIPAGETEAEIVIPVINDSEAEDPETVILTMTGTSGDANLSLPTLVADQSATLSIADGLIDQIHTDLLQVLSDDLAATMTQQAGQMRGYAADALTRLKSREVSGNQCAEKVNEILENDPILFASDSASISPESTGTLDQIASVLGDCSGEGFEIGGHTDARASDAYNLDLSQRRVDAVLAALAERGVDVSAITTQGYGESRPVANNGTEEGMAENRRVEFTPLTPVEEPECKSTDDLIRRVDAQITESSATVNGSFNHETYDCYEDAWRMASGTISYLKNEDGMNQAMANLSFRREAFIGDDRVAGRFLGFYGSNNSVTGLAIGEITGLGLNAGVYGAQRFDSGLFVDYYLGAAAGYHQFDLEFDRSPSAITATGAYKYVAGFAGAALSGETTLGEMVLTPRIGVDVAASPGGDVAVTATQGALSDSADLQIAALSGARLFAELRLEDMLPNNPVRLTVSPRYFCDRPIGQSQTSCGAGGSIELSREENANGLAYNFSLEGEKSARHSSWAASIGYSQAMLGGTYSGSLSLGSGGSLGIGQEFRKEF